MLSISQAAKRTHLSVKSIRHYESIGLISPARGDNDYRYYSKALLEQLHFIKRAKDAGFNLKEIKGLLHLYENTSRSSADVKAIALQKITELKARIEQQQALLKTLTKITEQCNGDDNSTCTIIDAFSRD